MKMKRSIFLLALAAGALPAGAQMAAEREAIENSTDLISVGARARFDWQETFEDNALDRAESGFEAKYLLVRLDGRITEGLTYSWRQRLNRIPRDANFFDQTDWLYITYVTHGLHLSAGKQTVLIGGYEYDRNPSNVFGWSTFVGNIAPFQMGASIGYELSSRDLLTFQVSESPFYTPEARNRYALNLYWQGQHGPWSTLWSLNFLQGGGHWHPWMNYIALGNRFDVGKAWLELDLMSRSPVSDWAFCKNTSVVANLGYDFNRRWTASVKFSWDRNDQKLAQLDGGPAYGMWEWMPVQHGTDIKMLGAVCEFYPYRKERGDVRLHAAIFHSWGKNTDRAEFFRNKTLYIDAGLTFDLNLFSR